MQRTQFAPQQPQGYPNTIALSKMYVTTGICRIIRSTSRNARYISEGSRCLRGAPLKGGEKPQIGRIPLEPLPLANLYVSYPQTLYTALARRDTDTPPIS